MRYSAAEGCRIRSTLSALCSFIALLGLLTVLTTGPLVAQRPPTPEAALAQAKQSFNGNLLLWPPMSSLRSYSWEAVSTINQLDSSRRLTDTAGFAVVRYKANSDSAEHRVYQEGKLLKTRTIPLSEVSVPSCPITQQRCLEMRAQVLAKTRFEFVATDNLNGRSSLVFRFETERPSKDDFPLAIWSANSIGKLWLDSTDLTLVKVEGEYTRPVVVVKGLIVGGSVIPKGAKWRWETRRNQNGDWLPSFREESRPEHKFPWGAAFSQRVMKFEFDTFPEDSQNRAERN